MKFLEKLVFVFIFSITLLPIKALAHGEASEPQTGVMINTNVLIGTIALFVLFFGLYTIIKKKVKALSNVKKQEDRIKRQQLSKTLTVCKWAWIVSLIGILITGSITLLDNGTSGQKEVYLEHIHGLGYSTDGKRILIPAHDGLRAYSEGHWETPEGEKHDYMGFSPVDDGFYSSGHPASGSDKKNPFGIVKSADEGKTLQFLDLYGEVDFHNMAVGYKSHTIYVMNPQPNPRMDSVGLYYSKDQAKTWTKSQMNGISEEPTALSVHPTKEAVVAIGTQSGVYLSKDYGKNFEKVLSDGQATALYFNSQGILFVGGYNQGANLKKFDMDAKKTDEVKLPVLKEDAVAYLAENAIDEKKLAFATFNKDVYVSNDKGLHWTKIADQGKGISEENH